MRLSEVASRQNQLLFAEGILSDLALYDPSPLTFYKEPANTSNPSTESEAQSTSHGHVVSPYTATAPPFTAKFIGRKTLHKLGLDWSNSQLLRLEAAGKFPRRIYLSPHKIAWNSQAIAAWMDARISEQQP